ncbi:spore germination protein [Alicyclobacillus tolerans]|uniref:spore germination protein n=1 Tax=Alicyclobacillus tolerans TaxID=90970 RepID=UPI00355760B8|nr:spore germination protein [Alicyclobacillus tolerans]
MESSVRGSQVSFVENIDINIGLIRSTLNTDTLHVKKFKVGYRSRRDVALIYLGDVNIDCVNIKSKRRQLQTICHSCIRRHSGSSRLV